MSSIPKPDVQPLIESYQDYAHAIAAEVCRKLPTQLDRRELEGAADLGLVEAAQAFDPSRGVLFKTFAYYRIRGAVYDALRKMGWFSKSLYQQYKFEMAANEYLKDYSESTPPQVIVEAEYEEIKNFTGSVLSCYLLSLEDLTQEISDSSDKSPEQQAQTNQEQEQTAGSHGAACRRRIGRSFSGIISRRRASKKSASNSECPSRGSAGFTPKALKCCGI